MFAHMGALHWHVERLYYRLDINKFFPTYYLEKDFHYIEPSSLKNYRYIQGFFQNYHYVDQVADELRRDCVPLKPLSEATLKTCKEVESKNSVFLGVRRGDFVRSEGAIRRFGVISKAWFEKAMSEMEKRVDDPVFYVFSNDIDWCIETFKGMDRNLVYRMPADQTNDFEELMIMRSCRHSIMCNSTYHWWGAYLNEYPGKVVIAPTEWNGDGSFADMVPDRWIKIDRI